MIPNSDAKPPVSLLLSLSLLGIFLIVFLGGAAFLIPFAMKFHAYQVSSNSMAPTLYAGDHIFANQAYYAQHSIADGDLVVFRREDRLLIKRVSAIPGEIIEGRVGVLYRNDVALGEPYASFSKDSPLPEIENFSARKIAADEIFVTGDSRDMSLDSRSQEFGPVHMIDVVGRVSYVYLSSHSGQTGRRF
jgi:signal peptidase I